MNRVRMMYWGLAMLAILGSQVFHFPLVGGVAMILLSAPLGLWNTYLVVLAIEVSMLPEMLGVVPAVLPVADVMFDTAVNNTVAQIEQVTGIDTINAVPGSFEAILPLSIGILFLVVAFGGSIGIAIGEYRISRLVYRRLSKHNPRVKQLLHMARSKRK